MKKESIIYGAAGLLAGVIVAWAVAVVSVNNNYTGMMSMMGMHSRTDGDMMVDDMSMGQMSSNLKGKTGDDFDKTFLSGMIAHHQGAIDMAKLAQKNAKHQEIKKMADDIMSAQSKEIDQMQTWQTTWGYKNTPQIENHTMSN